MGSWRGTRTVALIAVGLLAIAASCGDDDDEPADDSNPPSVFIDAPGSDQVLVRQASFEIAGGLGGSVNTIDVSIDGVDQGPARSGDPGRWRFPASQVSISSGLHEISVTATGPDGTATAQLWVFYEPDLSVTYEMRIVPDSSSYAQEDASFIDDPQLLLIGPADDEVQIDLTTETPPELRATINPRLATGSLAFVSIDNVGEPPPGSYDVVVRGVSDAGFEREATHVVTITGAAPDPTTTQPAPTTAPGGTFKVVSDDFEGADQWTATVTWTTNGASATAELAGGGNPGGQRRMAHVLPGTADGDNNPTQITVLHVFDGGGWDPATDGALASVDYSEDQIEFEPPFAGAAIGTLFVIVQDGTTYSTSINENNAFSNTAWQAVRVEGLTAADFAPAPGPDFSAAGAPMTFGYLRSNTSRGATDIITQNGIDNWTVELFGV